MLPAPTPTPTPTITSAMWSPCGSEGGYCSFSGTMQVRYGANGQYAYQIATGSTACSNGTFGDPAYGVTKTCEYTPLEFNRAGYDCDAGHHCDHRRAAGNHGDAGYCLGILRNGKWGLQLYRHPPGSIWYSRPVCLQVRHWRYHL